MSEHRTSESIAALEQELREPPVVPERAWTGELKRRAADAFVSLSRQLQEARDHQSYMQTANVEEYRLAMQVERNMRHQLEADKQVLVAALRMFLQTQGDTIPVMNDEYFLASWVRSIAQRALAGEGE